MFIKKKSDLTFNLHVKVKPNSKRQYIVLNDLEDSMITIHVKSPAKQNKANKELIDILKKKLSLNGSQIRIISGMKNPKKIVQVSFKKQVEIKNIINRLME
ncbi:MAG: DUF167 domain-containing protein [Promethearchaeota archaeon]